MPKRSERDRFDPAIFSTNPFRGKGAEEVYEALRWGNPPTETWEFRGPESMATIGELARIDIVGRKSKKWGEQRAPYLAVGVDSNLLYVVPKGRGGIPKNVPRGPYRMVGNVKRTDYYADKGGELAYFYHKHERPYPILCQHPSGVWLIVPSVHKRRRSYAVAKEGIVG